MGVDRERLLGGDYGAQMRNLLTLMVLAQGLRFLTAAFLLGL